MARRRRSFFLFSAFFYLFSWEFGVLAAMHANAITPCDSLSALLTVPCCTIFTCIARGLSIKHSVTT